jgi:hypothetical protein
MLDPTAPWIEAPSASDLSICSNIWAHEGQPIREGRTSPSGRVPPVAYRPRSVAANVSELEKAVAADALVSVSYQIPLRPLPAGVKGPAAHAPKPILLARQSEPLRLRARETPLGDGRSPLGQPYPLPASHGPHSASSRSRDPDNRTLPLRPRETRPDSCETSRRALSHHSNSQSSFPK